MRYAMAYPDVRFSLSQDGRLSFATNGNGDLAEVLVETLGLEIAQQLLPVQPPEDERPPIAVYGYTSAPTSTATRAPTSRCSSTGGTFRMPA